MRFAPPAALRPTDRGGGLNQTSVRAWNERHVMSLLRQHEWLSRADITQLSGLSAQAVSVIISALEADQLISTGELLRGKVGPPARLLALNPDGAFSIGLKIGLKSTDLVLLDFVGGLRHSAALSYERPDRDAVLGWADQAIAAAVATLPPKLASRIIGLGVSLPEEIENWPLDGWPGLGKWSEIDLEQRLAAASGLPVFLQNDVTAAAGTEVILGVSRELGNFAYVFVGARTAIRLVLNSHIHAGREGPDPIPSLLDLESALRAAGVDAEQMWDVTGPWRFDAALADRWQGDVARGLATATEALARFVDVTTVVVDGRLPADVRTSLCERLRRALGDVGLTQQVAEGHAGPLAKSIGAASLPLHSRFMVDEVGLAARR